MIFYCVYLNFELSYCPTVLPHHLLLSTNHSFSQT